MLTGRSRLSTRARRVPDHTREHVPLLATAFARRHRGRVRHDGPLADVGATVLRWLTGAQAHSLPGRPSC